MLQPHIVGVVQVIHADYCVAVGQEELCNFGADEASRAGDEIACHQLSPGEMYPSVVRRSLSSHGVFASRLKRSRARFTSSFRRGWPPVLSLTKERQEYSPLCALGGLA
jgi:hypothetical protein